MTRLRDLSARDRALAVRAAALQAFVVPAVRVLGFRRVKSALAALAPLRKTVPPRPLDRAREAARVAHGVARRVLPRATCVPRSLVLWALLRRMGIDARIRFGARKAGKGIEAHAWVEVEGEPLAEGARLRSCYSALDGPQARR